MTPNETAYLYAELGRMTETGELLTRLPDNSVVVETSKIAQLVDDLLGQVVERQVSAFAGAVISKLNSNHGLTRHELIEFVRNAASDKAKEQPNVT
jgi:hypothetical protein